MDSGKETSATLGFPHGRSDYEPGRDYCWTTWGTVSSGFREIELRWDRLESVGHVAHLLPHRAHRRSIRSRHHDRVLRSVSGV